MASLYDDLYGSPSADASPDGTGTPSLLDDLGMKPAEKSGIARRVLGDTGVSLMKGLARVPEMAVGLADIPTGGRAGKLVDDNMLVGFKGIQDDWADLYSPEQKAANAKVQGAEGFGETLGQIVDNPSVIPHAVVESLPSMLAGGAIGKGLKAAPVIGQKISSLAAGAIGEGAVMAGSAAEGTRQQTEDGLLTPKQQLAAAGTGVLGAVVGVGGAKIARGLGLGDVDTAMVDGALGASSRGLTTRIAGGAAVEGGEELLQSSSEVVSENFALDRELTEGVGNAAAMGLVTGGAMGAGFGALSGRRADLIQPAPTAENPAPAPVPRPDPSAGAISRIAAMLPAPGRLGLPAPDSVMFADGQGNVSDQAPLRDVDREYRPTGRERNPQTFGAGMDRQTERGAQPGREGDFIPASRFAGQQVRASETFDGQLAPEPAGLPAPQRRLTDGRPDAGFIETNAAGESRQAKAGNVPPKDYVPQGGRGMDQQTPVGKRYSNALQAKNAIQKAGVAATHEAVQVAPKQFEVRAKPVPKKRIVNRDRDSLTQAITRLGGIKTNYRQDTTGDTKGNKFLPGVGALWSDKTGTSLDDMASLLDQNGYVPAGEMSRDGGVSWLQSALSDELSGRRTTYAPGAARQEAELLKQEAERNAAQLESLPGDVLEAKLDAVFDLTEEVKALEARRLEHEQRVAELDKLFGDTDASEEQAAGSRQPDRDADQVQSSTDQGSGLAGSRDTDQGSRTDAPRDTPAEALELTQQTEAELADLDRQQKERDKAAAEVTRKADEQARKAADAAFAKQQNDAANAEFTLGGDAEQNLTGQRGMFDAPADPQPATPPSIEGADIDGDWALFSKESGTLGIARADMPQIKAEHRGAMVNFLNARDIAHQEETVPAGKLKPTQAEYSRKKVEKAKAFDGGDRSILISKDGHVLDGHHQWLARRDAGEDVKVIRLGAPIKKLLGEVAEFPSATQDYASGAAPVAAQAKPAAKTGSKKPAEKLENFGEKLEGKREYAASSLSQELTDEQITAQPLSKIWPANEIDAIGDKFSAAMAYAARAEIPAKPRKGYKLGRWVDAVKTMRGLSAKVLNNQTRARELLREMIGLDGFANKVEMLEAVDRSQWKRVGKVNVYRDAYTFVDGEQVKSPFAQAEIDGKTQRFDGATSVADIVEAVNGLLEGAAQPKKMQFEIRRARGATVFDINKVGDKEYRSLKTLPSVKEARAFIEGSHAELVAAWEATKDSDNVKKTDVRGTENRPRAGADHRSGKDVTPDQFESEFGFRGVEFGNWVGQGANSKERQGMLNAAYDALMDLATIVGIPPKAISLNGSLGLAFGSRGKGNAAAHFEPGNLVINLTKTKGAGVLAHEWFHALDNYFSRRRGGEVPIGRDLNAQEAYRRQNFITYRPEPQYVHKTRGGTPISKAQLDYYGKKAGTGGYYNPDNWHLDPAHPQGVRPEVESAFASLVQALDDSPMSKRSALNDKNPNGYWGRIIERAARAFENFTISKMLERGYHNDYLANVRQVEDFPRSKARYPYLLPEEVAPIAEAFDGLFGTIETETDAAGNVAMYRLSDTQAKGIPLFSARAIASKISKSTGLKVETVANEAGLPDAVQAQIKRDGVSGRVAGVYHNGTSYLIASNLRDTQHAISTVLHEAVGHGGVKAVLGDKIAGTMRQIYRDMPSALRSELERRYAGQARGLSQDDAQALIAEEYVAHLAETDPKHSIIGRLVALLRQMIRNTFGEAASLKWTRGDLVQLLAEARQAAGRDGNDGGSRYSAAEEMPADLPEVSEASEADFVASLTGSNAFARAIYKAQGTDSPFFQRWFGKSRMVDKQGRPVAFVHRSYGERNTFNDASLGGNSGTPTAALGHFLARKDVGNVERYGPVTEQFYIRMNKPKVVTQDQFEAMGDWSLLKIKAYRKTLMEQGHDGLYIQGLAWPVVFEGKNIKAARNAGTFDESSNVRYSLADDARALFDRVTGPAPLERDDPFAAENRRLREGEKTLWQKAKKQFARQFAPGGLLPDSVFAEKITRDSEFQAVEFDVRHLSGGLNKAVKADFGVDLDNLTAEQMKPLAEALAGRVDPAIPEATRVAIVAMRQYIDSLSGEYLSIIQGQIDAHQEKSATYGPALKAANDARKALTAAIASSSDPAITQAAATKKAALAAQVKAKKAMNGLKGDERATAKAAYEVAVKAHDKARSELRAALSPALKVQLKEVDALRATANDARSSTAEAKAEAALYEKIAGNLGAYVNRSYQAFDDPKWFKTVPTEVVNTARTYLAAGYMEQGETAAEAARLADVTVNEMLKNGTAYDSMGGFIAESKLGAKDLTVLIKRKEIAPEIRALLGEYMDPRMNFAKSATKMGRMVWNQRFLDRVLDFGMGVLFFEGKNRPADATTQIAGEKSESYAPLNGLWTFPEVAQSFQDALGKEQMSDLYRTVVRLNGMVKYGKTILSPTTAMRNWQSAMFFSLANGHFDLTQMKKSWAALREQVTQNATGEDLTYLRKLKQLGVVYDTPYAGEMMALMNDARMDELLSSKSGTGMKWLRKANQFAQGFYSFGDDFWKIIGYENEKASLIAAGIVEAEAETMAAERIRNTYPTYSMIGKAVQWLRRFPLAGTFVSFPSEIIRTTVGMMQLVNADLKSDNPKIRALGRKRAAGMAMVSAGFYALSAMTAAALGVGDDEEEALRDLAAPWSRNSTFLYTGRDADGKLRYFDMSFLDPYGYWKRPLTAMMRDQPWEDAAASGISDMLSPFFGADITAGAIFEVLANKKPTGGQVYNENAGSVDQLQDISNHMRKALQPGFVSNAERLWLAGSEARREGSGQPYDMRDEVVSLLGWRAATLDTQTGLYYRSFDFTDALSDAKKTLTRTLRSSNEVSEGDIRDSKQAANAQYQKAFTEMGRLVSSAGTAGMSRGEIVQTLKLSGVSQRNIFALMNGRVPPIDIGMQSQARAVQQARTMRDGEHAAEIARRFRLAREQ